MRHHEIVNTKKEIDGVLPLDERIFERSEINSCCRKVNRSPGNTDALPEDLAAYLEHMEPDLEIHDAVQLAADLPTGELVNFVLKECHRPLGPRLTNLETLLKVVEDSHGDESEAGEMTRRLRSGFNDLRTEVLDHLLEEEDVLFPWIESGNGSNAITVINEVKEQHKILAIKAKTVFAQAAWLLDRRETCSGQRALHAALKDFVTALAVHINVENHVLYARASNDQEA